MHFGVNKNDLAWILVAGVSVLVLRQIRNRFSDRKRRVHHERTAAAKRESLAVELQKATTFAMSLTEAEKQFLSKCNSIEALVTAQKEGKTDAITILKFYFRNLVEAQLKTNCIVGLDVEEAVAAAALVDSERRSGKPLRPLHGIPISIKDCAGVRRMDSTIGIHRFCLDPLKEDSPLVDLLRRSGAVIVGKTNVPQTMMSFECLNYVFGPCTHPQDNTRTPGGSSGGEGALLALNGAVCGIGTDIGGSIRIPAHFCGVYGLKPSQWRFSNRGFRAGVPGQEAVSSVSGPMARTIADLTTLFKVVVNGELWKEDGNTLAIPFREELFEKGLQSKPTVGFYLDDGFLATSPACRRAVLMAVDALRRKGFTVVELKQKSHTEGMLTFYKLLAADGARTVAEYLDGERTIPHITSLLTLAKSPLLVRRILSWMIGRKDRTLSKIVWLAKVCTVQEYWKQILGRNNQRHEFVDAMRAVKADIVIGPGQIIPAPKLNSTTKLSFGSAATAYYNLLDNAVVALPVTKVDKTLDGWEKVPAANCPNPLMEQSLRSLYDADEMHGLPVGVQVIGHRMNEEFVLGFATQLDATLRSSS
jgi:Asp-tRNA(Asn)/Glu-tRNA(Gln) amidotransferase A subunit family amidase